MFRQIGAPEILLILLVLVLVFGASRLPSIARNLGKSMKVMKEEIKDLRDEPAATPGTPPVQDVPPTDVNGFPPNQPPR